MASIVTVGICPCWDITCYVDGVSWGDHAKISGQTFRAAGKSLNVSRALAWMGVESTACGLWGEGDSAQAAGEMGGAGGWVDVRFTAVAGDTRRNITIVDNRNGREMHLRAESGLASAESLQALSGDLAQVVRAGTMCVLAGALPEDDLLEEVVRVARGLYRSGGKLIVDSCGKGLKRIVDMGDIRCIKPNVDELCELLGRDVDNNAADIVRGARELSSKVDMVLVSRGERGAIAVGRDFAVEGFTTDATDNVGSTVGCGDYLLAGFIAGGENLDEYTEVCGALKRAIRVAGARAWGLCDEQRWDNCENRIAVEIRAL